MLDYQGLEKIAAYMKSKNFIKSPVNNKMAKWGNKKEWKPQIVVRASATLQSRVDIYNRSQNLVGANFVPFI